MRDLNYNKYVEIGEHKITESQDYNSNNTHQLNVDEMKTLLLKLPLISSLISNKEKAN